MAPEYEVLRIATDFDPSDDAVRWEALPALTVGHYLWLGNGYEPKVEARVGCSDHYLYVRFEAFEKRVRVRHLDFQAPVYKDSCVEMFIDPFPDKGLGYLNFETNAAGTMLLGFGPGRHDRVRVPPDDLAGFRIQGSVRGRLGRTDPGRVLDRPLPGPADAVPEVLRRRPPARASPARPTSTSAGTRPRSLITGPGRRRGSPTPDFHRPEFFGSLVFSGRIADLASTP